MNLRQLGIALASYTQENGSYPLLWTFSGSYDDDDPDHPSSPNLSAFVRQNWYGHLMMYCSSPLPPEPNGVFTYEAICPRLFRCPGSYIKPGTPGVYYGSTTAWWNGRLMADINYRPEMGVPYAYNAWGIRGDNNLGLGGIENMKICSESDVKCPADMIAIGCSYSLFYSRYFDVEMGVAGWHSRQGNIAFADGHIELVKSNLINAPTDAQRRRWNRDDQPHL